MNKIGQIALYKKISSGRYHLGSKSENYFTTIGSFQHMKYTEYCGIRGFAELAKYDPSLEIDGVRYAAHSVFFYGDFSFDNEPFPKAERYCSFFSVGTLKLNKIPRITELYPCADTMIEKISTKIKDVIAGHEGWQGKNSPHIQIFPSLGTCDFVLIARGDDIHDLMDLWPLVRGIPMDDTGKECLIRSSNSFLAVHNTFRLSQDFVKKITVPSATLICAINGFNNSELLRDHYRSYFGESFFDAETLDPLPFYNVHGEFDVALRLDSCPLDKLLYLLGVRCDSEYKSDYDNIDKFDSYADSNIEATNVRFIYGSSPKGRNDKDAEVVFDNRIEEIKLLHTQVRMLLPITARRTLDFLVDKCTNLLHDGRKYSAGTRLYEILKQILCNLRTGSHDFIGDDFTEILGNIDSMVHSILMADNLRGESFGANDVETIYSGAKIYYAYENMLRKLSVATSEKNRADSLFFITVNPLRGLSSTHYLKKTKNESSSNVYNLNLPHIGHFELEYSIPYLGHELGHYVLTSERLNGLCNSTLKHLMESYVKLHVWDGISPNHLGIDKKNYIEFMNELLLSVKYEFRYNEPTRVFRRKYMDYLGMVYTQFQKKIIRLKKTLDQKQLDNYYFCSVVSALLKQMCDDDKPFELLSEVIKETRADIVMVSICDYNFKQFLESHFRYMRYNNIPLSLTDTQYTMRLAATLAVLSEIDGGETAVKDYLSNLDLDQEEKKLLSNVIDFWQWNRKMLEPLIGYLKKVKVYVGDKLLEAPNIDNTLKLFRYPATERCRALAGPHNDPSCDNLPHMLYREWYEALRYWNDKSKHHLERGGE